MTTAPAGWLFDDRDFWIEEHGLIMEAPEVPIVATQATNSQRFLVTGDREITTVLTITPTGQWSLAEGTLYDVTHLPCRSGRYISTTTPPADNLNLKDYKNFPVAAGAMMPVLTGFSQQDYAVLFVVGVEA